MEGISSKVLLYGTKNYVQYPMINHTGKEYLEKNVYVCITESLWCTAVINTTLYINYTSTKNKNKFKKKTIPFKIISKGVKYVE